MESLKATLSGSVTNSSLGDMYNLFYYQTLIFDGDGCLIDKNGDGIEELLLSNYGGSYTIYTYRDGKLSLSEDNTPHYAGLLAPEQIRALCKVKTEEHGFTLNRDFVKESDMIGYVKTEGGTLNLRSAATTSSDVIVQIPNHTFFNVYQDPANMLDYWGTPEWYYVSVSVNGKMYSGYVSNDYVDVWNTAI